MALRETLRGLCSKTGWCYAVFWKLKRRSRMVLTWEDGYYEHGSSLNLLHEDVDSSAGTGGNPLDQGGFRHETSYSQGQIELAVAKLSFCVYFMGEGIIGRVAFTGKHQWVFGNGDLNHRGGATGGGYPAGWQTQFAAGIKTIAVIAVPQGVLQLGSTQLIIERMDWVNHVKSAFGALQNVPGPPLSDLLSDGQAGKTSISALAGTLSPTAGKPTITPPTDPFNVKKTSDVVSQSLGKVPSNMQGFERVRVVPKVKLNPSEDTWSEAKDCSAKVLQAVSETCSAVTQLDLVPNLNQLSFTHGERLKGGYFREADELKGYPHPPTAVRNAMEAKVDAKMRTGLGSIICPELSYNEKDVHASRMFSLHNSLDVSNEGIIGARATNEITQSQPQVRLSSATVISSQLTGLDATAPSQSQASSIAQDFASRRMFNYNAGNLTVGPPSIACIDGQEGSALSWGACVKSSHLDLCESMRGTRSQPDSICPVTGHNVWESDCTVTSTASFMPSSIAQNIKSGCRDLELDCGRFGTSMDELDKYMASLSSEQNGKWDLSFAIGDELSQALGPAFKQGKDKDVWEEMLPYLGGDQGAEPPKQAALGRLYWIPEQQFFDTKSEALLEAVVANSSITNGNASSSSKRTNSVLDSELSALSASKEVMDSKPAQSFPSHDSLPQCFGQAAPAGGASLGIPTVNNVSHHPTFRSSTSDSSFRTILSTFVEDLESMKSDSTQASQLKKPEELAKMGRKRARPGESARPRPKDRQQIQDRVRELREIVPNGSKCSIDALLEKTIKHMLFLQNVMLHADKLKKSGEFKDDAESGASWALEVGGDELSCPILVKDLNQPRQLLVEMFCEERGHFLEIADAIRSLGLTILKGVMESRMDKIWARFIVEANRDVHRLEVMVSLTQLLHVNSTSSSSSMTMGSQSGPLRS